MAARPWTDADDAELRALHADGKTLHAIAGIMGRGKATIHRKAKDAGLDFDRTQTAKAAEAVHVDNKARRVRIVARMYARMEHLQDRLEALTFHTILKGEYGAESPRELEFVPTVDERNIADTINRYSVAAVKLEQVDAAADMPAVDQWLAHMTGGAAPDGG